uniref:C2H2-type domain-containing protein n=1 Tax=Sinocyclocheilus anshuiensis TaxID=1608454 RepID=A0A671M2I2_9TELE
MSEINEQQDTGLPVTTGESNESVNQTGSDCSEGLLLTNAEVPCTEVQDVDNMNGAVPLSKDEQIEERELTCDLECFLDHCKEFVTSQDGSTCASNHANIDTSSTSNRDENICPTIDSLSVCQSERTTPDPENTSSNPEPEKTFVISGDGKCSLGDYQLDTTEKKTCNGKKYHCSECQESAQSVDELIEHYHCMHSLHKSQYCSTCESYFTGGTLAGQHFCGKAELNDKIKPSPSHTKGLTEEKAKFICRYCRKSFVRQAYYEEHELKHRVVTHHRCDRCGLYFPNAHKCQRHKRKATCTPLILDPCLQTADHSESSHEKSDMADVVETVGSNVELRNCFVKLMDVLCGKTFRLRAQLNAHLRSHSDEKPFKCDNCGKAFKYTWNLNKHKREQCSQKIVPQEKSSVPDSKLPPKFKCPICFHVFKYSYNRTRHLRQQCLNEYMKKGKGKIGDKYRCPLCKDVFTVASNRNRHIKQTCIKLKLYTAKGKVKQRKELEELNSTKKKDKESPLTVSSQKALQYKCTFCPAEYSSKSGFYGHLAKHKLLGHAKKAIKHKRGNAVNLKSSSSPGQRPTSQECADDTRLPFSCRFCGRAFASPDSLKKHLRLHKGNKPFRCLDCGKNFVLPSIGDLLEHRQSHPKKGMLKCPDCPLQFKFPVFLLRHVAVHERRRKLKELLPPKDQATPQKVQEIYKEEFKCGLCQEAFIDSKALSEHCLTHMPGPSASKCQFCKRHFSSRTGLIRHIRLHTGEKPFPCLTCGRHFHRKE